MVAAGAMNLAGAVFMNGSAVQVQAQHVKVGLLTCHASSGFGLIFGTTRDVNCALHVDAGKPQSYVGHIESFGFAGYTEAGVLIWAVLAPTTTPGPGALAGTYETHPGPTPGYQPFYLKVSYLTKIDVCVGKCADGARRHSSPR